MNIKIYLLGLFVFLGLLICLRIMMYNKYISNISKPIENFSDNNKKNSSLKLSNNIQANPKIIYTSIMGETFYINGPSCLVISQDNSSKMVDLTELLNIKRHIYVDGGYFNYIDSNLVLFQKDLLYVYCFKTKSIKYKKKITEYFNITEHEAQKLDTVLVYLDKLLLFIGDKLIKINEDKTKQTLLISEYFPNLPSKIDCAFINFLDIIPNIPIGTPTFIKKNEIYYLDLKDNTIKGPRLFSDGLLNNVKVLVIQKHQKKFTIETDSHYRIYISGGGNVNGGYGGLIYNDFYLKKTSNLSLIVGQPGQRIPVKGKESLNKLNNIYNIKLPYNSYCSGAGGSFFYINNTLELVAGGGGGWSNEQIDAPDFCHSQKFSMNNLEPHIVIPIKKIIIITEKSKLNQYLIEITKLNIINYNLDNLNISVTETPKPLNQKESNQSKYSTTFDSNPAIEIEFSVPITSYSIELDYIIKSTGNTEFINSKVIIMNEQYQKLNIDNFNYTFNYKYITSSTIYKFLNNTTKQHGFQNVKSANGNKNTDLVTIFKNKYDDFNDNKQKFKLEGGLGGGGGMIVDRNSELIVAGGGGGYEGGKSNSSDNYRYTYVGGSGGTSYIKNINFKQYKNKLSTLFKHDFSNSSGFCVIHKINTRSESKPTIDFNESKGIHENKSNKESNGINETKSKKESNNDNKDTYNNDNEDSYNNDNEDSYNTFSFFNKNVETFYESHNLNTKSIGAKPKDYSLNNLELDAINTKMLVIPINIDTKYTDLYYKLETNLKCPFSSYQIYWNEHTYKRCIFTIKDKFVDDISILNHGQVSLNKSKMTKYLKFLCKNGLYKHINYLSYPELKKMNISKVKGVQTLSDLKNMKLESIKENKGTHVLENTIKIDKSYTQLFLCIKTKKECKIKMTKLLYNSKTLNKKDVLDFI